MKHITICALAALVLLSASATAQFKDRGLSAGLGIGVIKGNTDPLVTKARAYGRGYVRTGIVPRVAVELGAAVGEIAGRDFRTAVSPFDLRLLFSPLNSHKWNPYLYAGGGALFYDV